MVAEKSSFFEPVSAQQLQIIRQELNEYEGKTVHVRKILEQWIKLQPNFPQNIDEDFLSQIIRLGKHNLDKSKRKLENYVAVKTENRPIFQNRDPNDPDLLKIQTVVTMAYSPRITDQGSRVVFFAIKDPKVENYDVTQVLKFFFMTMDCWVTVNPQFCGEIAVFDCQNVTAGHIPKLLTTLKMAVDFLKQAYTIRLKQVHIVNVLPTIETLINAIKPLLNKKIRENIFVHKSHEGLLKQLPKECVPENYGGTSISTEKAAQNIQQLLCNSAQWFQTQEAVKFLGHSPKTVDELASFRRLNID